MIESFTLEPKHISELLADSVHAQPDKARIKAVKKTDLESEIDGLTEDIAVIQGDMRRTGDPELPQALDEATDAAMMAQRELRELNGE